MISRYAMDEVSMTDWDAMTIGCLILAGDSTASPVPQNVFLTDIDVATNELDVVDTPAYERVILGATSSAWDIANQKARFHCPSPNFGVLVGGIWGGYVFYEEAATDAERRIIRAIDGLTATEFDGVTDFIIGVNAAGLFVKENG